MKLFKAGLVERKRVAVNWCPNCKTVLSDEQVLAGICERCKAQVGKKETEQWFFKITNYAERLLKNLEKIDWSEKTKVAQRNWIGKAEGIEIEYEVLNSKEKITCFTTRPDTNFGATFVVLAPEHPLIKKLKIKDEKLKIELEKYTEKAKKKSEIERIAEGREKRGVFTGFYGINQLTGKRMPIWVSDFVLASVGTGAVVGVPGHDKRDFEFAKEYNLPVVRVVVGPDGDRTEIVRIEQVQEEAGVMINSGFLNGMETHKAIHKIIDYLEEKGWGKRKVVYRLRDWCISRQRYWGPPIPVIYCKNCAKRGESWATTLEGRKAKLIAGEWADLASEMKGWYPVDEKDLPILLPETKDFMPDGSGKSPLSRISDFYNVSCPRCGKEAVRETDVSDTFLDSAWYFFRYTSTDFDKKPFDERRVKKWLPVDMYIGGHEHACLHLMYTRFITMVFHDLGLMEFEEPFKRFYAHGLLIKEGAKMSKSKGNIVVPDEYIERFGADALRCYLMFLGPFDKGGDFQDRGMVGMRRFLERVWKLVLEAKNREIEEAEQLSTLMYQTIKKVTEDIQSLHYNTALARIMEYVNGLSEYLRGTKSSQFMIESAKIEDEVDKKGRKTGKIGDKEFDSSRYVKVLLLLLAPFAPHMTEDLWERMNADDNADKRRSARWSIHQQPWPKYDSRVIKEVRATVVVQVNGKLRDKFRMASEKSIVKSQVEERAKKRGKVLRHLKKKKIKKVFFVPGKLINFVI